MAGVAGCRVQKGQWQEKNFRIKKHPNEFPKVGGPKRQVVGNVPQNDTPFNKCLGGSDPPLNNRHVSLPHWGILRDIFQCIHPCPDTSARAEGGIVGTFSHVSTHVYLHASVHVAIPQLNHMSLLPSLSKLLLKHSETFYPDHLGPLSGPHFPDSPKSSLICEMMII